MNGWRKARKKPVEVEFREVEAREALGVCSPPIYGEAIPTLEGTLIAVCGQDFIIRGVKGELYPIKKEIFYETYEVVEGV